MQLIEPTEPIQPDKLDLMPSNLYPQARRSLRTPSPLRLTPCALNRHPFGPLTTDHRLYAPCLSHAHKLTSCVSPITMVGIPNSEKVPLTRQVLIKLFALLLSMSMLAWGIPSAGAQCGSAAGCEAGKLGMGSGMGAHGPGPAQDCCSGSEGGPCETALDRSLPQQSYALATQPRKETPLPASSAVAATLVSFPDHCVPRAAASWKAPPATPGAPLYLNNLSLRI
jgi:hypothetical protein